MAEPDDGAPKEKKNRRYATVLVAVPGWPVQDPGRLMIWKVCSSPQKAARTVKRLTGLMPEYAWSHELLSNTEAREVKLKPFTLTEGLARPVEMRFTGRTWKSKTAEQS